jgi:hypothetical protein
MGKNPYLWFIPVYGKGPPGDGIYWEKRPGGVHSEDIEMNEREVEVDTDEDD